ncbi:MAG: prolipoprotein diacylglyceryl transferase, partial [Planctomycetota bacterium]|nr:prolipoprotein diacylglyceryl transferase [Planctomycetota bacterium]
MSLFLAEAYFHTLDPDAISLWGKFSVKWYGLSYAMGFLLSWLFFRWMAKTDRSPLSVQGAGDLMFYMILGVLLGGRLGYVVFYDPMLFITFTSKAPFWGLLAINQGGMSSHGGIIGVIIAVCMFCRSHSLSKLHMLDLSTLASTAGLMLGRLANF